MKLKQEARMLRTAGKGKGFFFFASLMFSLFKIKYFECVYEEKMKYMIFNHRLFCSPINKESIHNIHLEEKELSDSRLI